MRTFLTLLSALLTALPLGLSLCLGPAQAFAQAGPSPARPLPPGSTLLLLPGGDIEGVAPSSHLPAAGFEKQTRAALMKAIEQIGYHPMVAEKGRSELIRRGKLSTCRAVMSCDRKATLGELGADAVVVYALWLREGAPAQLTITVTRMDFEGSSSRAVTEESLTRETKALFASALTKAEREQRVLVQLDSTPQGATVTIDQRHTKTTPAQFHLLPGAHQVVAEMKGYVTLLDGFELEPDETHYRQTLNLEAVDVLSPVAAAEGNVDRSLADAAYEGPRSDAATATTDYVVGGVLAAGALGLLTVGTVMALQDGNCAKQDPFDDACVLRKDFARYPLWLAGGVVAAAGSAAIFIFTPFTSPEGDTAGVNLSGTF